MQLFLDEIAAIYIAVPIVIGTVSGYAIGGQTRLKAVERIVYGGVVSLIGGIMTALIIASFIPPNQFSFLLAVLGFAGGCALGMGFNWAPIPAKPPQRHVVFDPEEDDKEFDRQIEDAFRGSDD
ncbi:MAG: hypothetical protein ACFFF4_05945 [Candidatus Thorarchaeota archaeon]